MEGIHPLNGMPIPENYLAHSLTFPSWEALADAVYRIGEAEIGYVMGRALPPGLIPVISISSAADYTQMLQMVTMDEFKYAIQIILGANSARELEYQFWAPTLPGSWSTRRGLWKISYQKREVR